MATHNIIEEGRFRYAESGDKGGTPFILLHGLLGALSNFDGIVKHFSESHNVLVPILPIFEISLRSLSVMKLVEYVEEFIEYKGYKEVHLLGNSLGGHIAQLYTLKNPDRVRSMILTGSSGLFESAMGTTFPKRGNYEYMKQKAESVFYDPAIATKELVDQIYETVNDLKRAMCVVALAKSAVRHNLEDRLDNIKVPTLLVWGIQDNVTPIWVGEKFNELIPNSELVKVDKCGHAPMMERPDAFNKALGSFVKRVESDTFVVNEKQATIIS
jgi:2-hydroxy-6-oxonona-2,4-dienedioate hydrolase